MRLPLAALVAGLLFPAAASAATAEVKVIQGYGTYAVAQYEAAPGEVNDLTAQGATDPIVLTDTGAEITPGPGCTAITAHSVTCTSPSTDSDLTVYAELGDEADHFTSEGPSFDAEGGPGDDDLEGGAAGGTLEGDEGDDTLRAGVAGGWLLGGDGADELTGSDRNDQLRGGAGPDKIDGAGQFDTDWSYGDIVSYEDQNGPVTVDLSEPGSPAGAAGEGDTISNVESVHGSRGPDTITLSQDLPPGGRRTLVLGNGGNDLISGGPGPDELYGDRSHDRIRGAGGDDVVGGGPGRDTLDGGAGENEMGSSEGDLPERDVVRCGAGGSVSVGSGVRPLLDLIDQSCGRLTFFGGPLVEVLHAFKGQPVSAVQLTPQCWKRCVVAVELHAHGRVVGAAQREIKRERSGTLTMPLSRAVRDELAQAGALKLGVSIVVRWGARLRHRDATGYSLLLHGSPPAR
ncbi:MAG TPA: calcium-binding protein [Thermoleophilaceae bacterium]|nr:calcium-binding protein [Thermoleophilaceae bacterium]